MPRAPKVNPGALDSAEKSAEPAAATPDFAAASGANKEHKTVMAEKVLIKEYIQYTPSDEETTDGLVMLGGRWTYGQQYLAGQVYEADEFLTSLLEAKDKRVAVSE